MNVEFSYHCGSCKELTPRAPRGTCPTCGSQFVIPLGWYYRSVQERSEWLRRIRGQRRKGQRPSGAEGA
jgi:rRNA maturation endonuclease Nob1